MKKLLAFLGKSIGYLLAYAVGTAGVLALVLYILMWMFCDGPSPSARRTFVVTMLETGNLKFVTSWYLSQEEILEIVGTGGEEAVAEVSDTDPSLISIGQRSGTATSGSGDAAREDAVSGTRGAAGSDAGASGAAGGEEPLAAYPEDVSLVPITGRTFGAQLLIVRDPARVRIATAYPWSSMEMEKNGLTVGEYCEVYDALAATNAGEFETPGGINWGGRPIGVVVCGGEVQFAEPGYGDVLVGFNEDHILVIADVGRMSPEQFAAYVRDNHIVDGASFKDISGGNTNHFTKLIVNGEPVELNGKGVGANPRTAIGQCADGTVLILVTDGRGSSGHLGATGQDLINVLLEYGAVNAANLDGGSSSSLYYDGSYRITSSYLPNSDASRRLPTAFIVTRGDGGNYTRERN